MPNILEAANELVYGDRAATYGSYDREAQKLALLFSIVLDFQVPVEKVPLLMVMLKACRLSQNPTHTDSWLDIAGYVGCAGKIDTIWKREPESEPLPVEELEKVFSVRPADSG